MSEIETFSPEDFGEDETPTSLEINPHVYDREKPELKTAPTGDAYRQFRWTKGKRVGIKVVTPPMMITEPVSYYKGDRTKPPSIKVVFMKTWTYTDAEGKKVTVDLAEENSKFFTLLQWAEVDAVVHKLQHPEDWGVTGKEDLDVSWDKLCELFEISNKVERKQNPDHPVWDEKTDPTAPLKWRPAFDKDVVEALIKQVKRNKDLTHRSVYVKESDEPGKDPYMTIYAKLDNFTETDDEGNSVTNKAQFIIGRNALDAEGKPRFDDNGEPIIAFDVLPWESVEGKRMVGRVILQIHDHFDGASVKNRLRVGGIRVLSEPSASSGVRIGMGKLASLDRASLAQTTKASSALLAALGAQAEIKPVLNASPDQTQSTETDSVPPPRRRVNRTGGLRAALEEGATEEI